MVLNISPKPREATETTEEPKALATEPSLNGADPEAPVEQPRRRTRRTAAAATPAEEAPATPPAPAARATRTRKTAAQKAAEAAAAEAAASETSAAVETNEAVASATAVPEPLAPAAIEAPSEDEVSPADVAGAADADSRPSRRGSRSRGGRGRGRGRGDRSDDRHEPDSPGEADDLATAEAPIAREDPNVAPELRPILRALEQQARQVERLARVTEDLARRADRPGAGGGSAVASPRVARVGVFVDTANIELATDRLRVRFDWSKVMRHLLKDRQLVRAVAYSPIHDDPAVSIETQRFVEPFLDRGFKIVTKPFRRFQDGSIKANLDIELALDVVAMLDRLDVLILVSGDGDFQRLVELAQSHGVRVEVAAVGASTAGNLRHAADEYIDLGSRARDFRA